MQPRAKLIGILYCVIARLIRVRWYSQTTATDRSEWRQKCKSTRCTYFRKRWKKVSTNCLNDQCLNTWEFYLLFIQNLLKTIITENHAVFIEFNSNLCLHDTNLKFSNKTSYFQYLYKICHCLVISLTLYRLKHSAIQACQEVEFKSVRL